MGNCTGKNSQTPDQLNNDKVSGKMRDLSLKDVPMTEEQEIEETNELNYHEKAQEFLSEEHEDINYQLVYNWCQVYKNGIFPAMNYEDNIYEAIYDLAQKFQDNNTIKEKKTVIVRLLEDVYEGLCIIPDIDQSEIEKDFKDIFNFTYDKNSNLQDFLGDIYPHYLE